MINIPVEIKTLKTGDYICEDVGVERKTIIDFAISILGKKDRKGRVFKQTERLNKEFKHAFLLINGSIKVVQNDIHPHAILGAIASIASKGTTVVWSDLTEPKFIYLMLKIFEKYEKLQIKKKKSK